MRSSSLLTGPQSSSQWARGSVALDAIQHVTHRPSVIVKVGKWAVAVDAIQLVTQRPSVVVKAGKGSVLLDVPASRGPASDLGPPFNCL